MKVHTTAFKEQIKEMGRELDSIITYGDTVLGNEQLNAVTPSFQGGILKSVMKQLDIDSNVAIPIGTTLNYKFGVKINDNYEYLDFGNYIVKEVEKQEDKNSYKIICYDKMLFSMKDYTKMPITYPITIREYINSLCVFLGLTFANSNDTFVNYNKQIPTELYLDSEGNSIGYTFRDVFDELSQVTASTICINKNDEVEIRYINDTEDTIDEEYLKDVNVNFGEKFGKINSIVLSRSGESDNIYLRDENSVAENGLCEIKIIDNQIMNFNNRDEFLPELLGKLNGLEYYLNDYSSTGITYYDVCDRYNVKIGDNTYSCVMFNDEILITQGLEENVFTEMPQETETDYTKADKTDRKINQTYLIVDKQNQQIQAVISQTDEQNQKIAQVTQTVEELNSKISDIADITTSGEDTDAKIELNEINQSEPIRLVVRPIGENISYLYPSDNLYPSDDLFMKIRTIRFHNNTKNEDFDYELPDDLLYYDSENYDEFILDYDGQSCIINKKVGYNADGTTYVLDKMKTVSYSFPKIILSEGDYTISILSYDTGYIFARLMAKNIYTTQFYTKSEVDSEISQTAQDIELKVNGKFENYSTTTEMNSAIQLSASNITSNVSQNYATKTAVENIENTLDTKIEQTADSITNTVSQTYSTKTETTTAKKEAINSANANTDAKLKNYSTTTQMKSEIKQTADAINLEVAKKVDGEDVVSTINQSAEQITLKSNRLVVDSTNFKLTKDGTITANAGTFGGTINTNKDLTVGNNAYIGRNQSSTSLDEKYIYMSDKSYIRRIRINNYENLSMNGDFVELKSGVSEVQVTNDEITMFAPYTDGGSAQAFFLNKDNFKLSTGSFRTAFSGGGGAFTLENYDANLSPTSFIRADATGIGYSHTPSVVSDKRLKQDIKDINVDWIDKLSIKEFEYKNTPDKKQIGLIAQDYIGEDCSKYFLNKNEDGYYSITYGNITNALIKYCQELKKEVANLKQEIEVLKNEK